MLYIGGKYFEYNEIDEVEFFIKKFKIDLEGRNLTEFKTNQDVDFSRITSLFSLNISKNLLKNVLDLHYFKNILILDISRNQIEDISFTEEMLSLNIFNAEYNNITSIASFNKCKNLEKLYISNNLIKYQLSSLKTLGNLNKLTELTIKENSVKFFLKT